MIKHALLFTLFLFAEFLCDLFVRYFAHSTYTFVVAAFSWGFIVLSGLELLLLLKVMFRSK